jgi:hypothetical protein
MTKYLPTLVLILTALGSALAPSIQHVVGAHPALFGALSSILGVVLHWLPSPAGN